MLIVDAKFGASERACERDYLTYEMKRRRRSRRPRRIVVENTRFSERRRSSSPGLSILEDTRWEKTVPEDSETNR